MADWEAWDWIPLGDPDLYCKCLNRRVPRHSWFCHPGPSDFDACLYCGYSNEIITDRQQIYADMGKGEEVVTKFGEKLVILK